MGYNGTGGYGLMMTIITSAIPPPIDILLHFRRNIILEFLIIEISISGGFAIKIFIKNISVNGFGSKSFCTKRARSKGLCNRSLKTAPSLWGKLLQSAICHLPTCI
jgi:hypothetical protein